MPLVKFLIKSEMKEIKDLLHEGHKVTAIMKKLNIPYETFKKNAWADCRLCRHRVQDGNEEFNGCTRDFIPIKQYGWIYCNKFMPSGKNRNMRFGSREERWSRIN